MKLLMIIWLFISFLLLSEKSYGQSKPKRIKVIYDTLIVFDTIYTTKSTNQKIDIQMEFLNDSLKKIEFIPLKSIPMNAIAFESELNNRKIISIQNPGDKLNLWGSIKSGVWWPNSTNYKITPIPSPTLNTSIFTKYQLNQKFGIKTGLNFCFLLKNDSYKSIDKLIKDQFVNIPDSLEYLPIFGSSEELSSNYFFQAAIPLEIYFYYKKFEIKTGFEFYYRFDEFGKNKTFNRNYLIATEYHLTKKMSLSLEFLQSIYNDYSYEIVYEEPYSGKLYNIFVHWKSNSAILCFNYKLL